MTGKRRISSENTFNDRATRTRTRSAAASDRCRDKTWPLNSTCGGPLELVAGKHYRCDTGNADVRKGASLAYKITRICLVP